MTVVSGKDDVADMNEDISQFQSIVDVLDQSVDRLLCGLERARRVLVDVTRSEMQVGRKETRHYVFLYVGEERPDSNRRLCAATIITVRFRKGYLQ